MLNLKTIMDSSPDPLIKLITMNMVFPELRVVVITILGDIAQYPHAERYGDFPPQHLAPPPPPPMRNQDSLRSSCW